VRTMAVVCSIAIFAITSVIVATEGVPGKTLFLVFTWLALLVPVMTVAVFWAGAVTRHRQKPRRASSSLESLPRLVAVLCNLVLAGFSCWALVSQYPYAEGNSVIPLGLLMVFTPIVSVVALLGGTKDGVRARRGSPA